jgi:uncharacterized protein YwqG
MDQLNNDLKSLLDQVIALKQELKTTDHTGRRNRLLDRLHRSLIALDQHKSGEAGFRILLSHDIADVRLTAARYCRTRDGLIDIVLATLHELSKYPGDVGRDARNTLDWHERPPSPGTVMPPDRTPIPFSSKPEGYSQAKAENEIRGVFSAGRAETIVPLLRPSIRVWPKPGSQNALASRFGGLPAVPPGWSWPFEFDEPLLFLAQFNCADVKAAVGPSELPERGMLAFFGDHDDVNGCGPTGGGVVYHFSDTHNLKLAALPLEDFEPLVSCDVEFYTTYEIPDPESLVIRSLKLSKEERDAYYDVSGAIGTPRETPERYAKECISKFFGWPNLVQEDLGSFWWHRKAGQQQLLLQIGWYHDGQDWESWGPGGTLYFTLGGADLAARRFELAELEVQCT